MPLLPKYVQKLSARCARSKPQTAFYVARWRSEEKCQRRTRWLRQAALCAQRTICPAWRERGAASVAMPQTSNSEGYETNAVRQLHAQKDMKNNRVNAAASCCRHRGANICR